MSNYDPALDSVFNEIDHSKPVDQGYLPRLPDGQHTVILTRFGGKPSQQAMGTILEADFIVETSTSTAVKPGDRRGWPWFPQQKGWGGAYESDRYKNFTSSIDQCVGNPDRQSSAVGRELAMGIFRGIKLAVSVVPRFNKDGSRATNKKGEPLSNATYAPIPQTMPEIQARAAQLPPEPVRQQQTQQFQGAPHPSQMPQQYPAQTGYQQQPPAQYPPQQQYQQQPAQYPPQQQYQQQPPQGYPQQPPQGYPQQPPQYPQQGQPGPAPGQGPIGILQGLK